MLLSLPFEKAESVLGFKIRVNKTRVNVDCFRTTRVAAVRVGLEIVSFCPQES